jgi:hypothetical protein
MISGGAALALLLALGGCARSNGESRALDAATLARSLQAHGVECAGFARSHDLFDGTELPSFGHCSVRGVALDINTFRSSDGRDIFELAHQGICPIAALRDDPVTVLPYVRGERWIVSVPNEIVDRGDEAAGAWTALASRVARALGGRVVTLDCPRLNA